VIVFGGLETWRRWKARKTPESQQFYRVPPRTRALVAATYLLLVAALAVGVFETHFERDLSDV
jgi:type II secretory pathway component PulM